MSGDYTLGFRVPKVVPRPRCRECPEDAAVRYSYTLRSDTMAATRHEAFYCVECAVDLGLLVPIRKVHETSDLSMSVLRRWCHQGAMESVKHEDTWFVDARRVRWARAWQ